MTELATLSNLLAIDFDHRADQSLALASAIVFRARCR